MNSYDEQFQNQYGYNVGDVNFEVQDQLQFQTFPESYDSGERNDATSKDMYFNPTAPQNFYNQEAYTGPRFQKTWNNAEDEEEPPLLEELGIDPTRIMEKTVAALNPFHRYGPTDDAAFLLQDPDLAGPLAFCIIMAVSLLVTGGKAHFGYIYGIAVSSCILMYCLLNLMAAKTNIPFPFVASVLGYCLLPVLTIPFIGLFGNSVGILIATLAVIYSSLSASRLFVTILGDQDQRALIAYPCALVYGAFALIIIF